MSQIPWKNFAAGPNELSPKLLRNANLDLNGVLKTLKNNSTPA